MVPVSRARNFSYAGNKLADFFSLQTPNTQHRMPNVERSIQALPLDVGRWTLSVCCVRLVRARCFLSKRGRVAPSKIPATLVLGGLMTILPRFDNRIPMLQDRNHAASAV